MTLDMRVRGAEKLSELSRELKRVANKDLQKELRAGLKAAVKPALRDAADSARATLPSRGGEAALVASTKFTISVRAVGRHAGVRVKARDKRDVEAINRGRLRHPVYGNRNRWVTQNVQAGWFDRPMDAAGPHVVKELNAVIDRIANQLGM